MSDIEETNHLLEKEIDKQIQPLSISNNSLIINPVEELLKNNNALPLLAVLDHFDINQDISPGNPLLNVLINKFLPLDFILNGKDIKFRSSSNGKTALHLAVEADDPKSVYWCLKNGHQNLKDFEGYTPIMQAIKLGFRRCFLLCLQFKHNDNEMAHVAAAYNRVWELQVMTSMKINFAQNRDSKHRNPLMVAVQNYSYEAAQELIQFYPSLNIDQLQNLTDSKAIIRRIKKARQNATFFNRSLWPFLQILLMYIVSIFLLILSPQSPYQFQYISSFTILISLYLTIFFISCCSIPKRELNQNILNLLKAPDFPTMKQVCPKCLDYANPQYDHCDELNCCIKNFHFFDYRCINYSNQNLWALVEFLQLFAAYWLYSYQVEHYQTISDDKTNQIPFILKPFRVIQVFILLEQYNYAISTVWFLLIFVHRLFDCLQIFGIMFMGRTYRQVNNTQKYPHLYRIVKLEDGTYRNKEIRIFQNGFCLGLAQGFRNILRFMVG